MGIEYYAFALFVTAMICVIAILFKLLFADVRRQKKLLDEKESGLLELYKTVENMMEEFADHVKTVTKDIQEHEDKITKLVAMPPPPPVPPAPDRGSLPAQVPEQIEKLPRSMTIDASAERIKAAGEVIEKAGWVIQGDLAKIPLNGNNKPTFKSFFDESANDIQTASPTTDEKQKRNDSIMKLASEGKTIDQIAKELGITQTEVNLIVNLVHHLPNN